MRSTSCAWWSDDGCLVLSLKMFSLFWTRSPQKPPTSQPLKVPGEVSDAAVIKTFRHFQSTHVILDIFCIMWGWTITWPKHTLTHLNQKKSLRLQIWRNTQWQSLYSSFLELLIASHDLPQEMNQTVLRFEASSPIYVLLFYSNISKWNETCSCLQMSPVWLDISDDVNHLLTWFNIILFFHITGVQKRVTRRVEEETSDFTFFFLPLNCQRSCL